MEGQKFGLSGSKNEPAVSNEKGNVSRADLVNQPNAGGWLYHFTDSVTRFFKVMPMKEKFENSSKSISSNFSFSIPKLSGIRNFWTKWKLLYLTQMDKTCRNFLGAARPFNSGGEQGAKGEQGASN